MDEYPSKNVKYWKRCQKKAHDYQSALRVIRTWAQYDVDCGYTNVALDHQHVISLIDRTLGGKIDE